MSVTTYMPLLQGLLTGKYRTLEEVPPFRLRTRHFSGDRPMSRHGDVGAEEEVMAAVNGVRAIAEELGEPMANVALAWVMAEPRVTCPIIGARNLGQLNDTIGGIDVQLSPEERAAIPAMPPGRWVGVDPVYDRS